MTKGIKKKIPFVLGAVVIMALISYVLLRPEKSVDMLSGTPDTTAGQLAGAETDHSLSTPSAGRYVDYSSGIVENTQGIKILFFHAPWCPQCQAIEKSIREQGVPKGVTIIKVDYDTSTELRKKYSVTLQTTFVRVSDDGTLQKKFVAYDHPSIDSVRQELL